MKSDNNSCCERWVESTEGMVNLIYKHPSGYCIKGIDVPISVCPWCGNPKRRFDSLENAARKVISCMHDGRGEYEDLKKAIGCMAEVVDDE